MNDYDVQTVSLNAPSRKAFAFLASPRNLPKWTSAFKRADDASALLATPAGELPIGLRVEAHADTGVIDWHMTMPDGTVAVAHSRVVPNGPDRCIYSFVLKAPPVPLRELEGELERQKKTLRAELKRLQELVA